jgi:hypothetical protein
MSRIYKPQGPSVALRESQRGGDPGYVQVPSGINQIESLSRQAASYLQGTQQQLDRNNQFQQTVLARAQRAQESNAQLALQQQQTRDNLALRSLQLDNQQALSSQRLQMQQQDVANQIDLNNQKSQLASITELGNSFIKFSETLWQKKAEQINKENEETRAALTNAYLANPAAFEPDVANVEKAEILRTQGLLNSEAAALFLEQNGQKAAATQVRAGNPFALRGIEEGRSIKASLGYQTYLQGKIRSAIDNGDLNILDSQFQAKVTQLVGIASNEYLKEQGLTTVNPGVLAKYFGYTKAQVEAQILESYGNQAYKTTKEAQKTTADALVYNSAAAISAMPPDQWAAEFQRLSAATTAAYSMNPLEGQKSMLQQLIKFSDTSGSFDLVEAFVAADRGDGQPFGATPGLQELYDKARTAFTTKQAALLEKAQADNIEGIMGEFNRVFVTGDVPAIREAQDAAVQRLMALGTPDAMAKARSIASTNPGESPMIQEQLRRAEDGGYLDQFLRENRDRMTTSTYDKYAKRAEQTSKLKEPAYQQALNQVLIRMKVAAGEANEQQQRLLPPHAKQALNDYTKLQQDKLKQYAREWLAQNPGSNINDFQDWLKTQEKSYADPKQFVVDPQSDMPRGMQSLGGGVEFTGNPLVRRVTVAGRMREDYRNPQVQAGLANGSVSGKAIQFNTDIVFTKQQVSDAVTNYEKNGTWPQFMVDIASKTGRSVKSMVQAQARVHGGSGVIMDPANFKLPASPSGSGKVSFDAVQSFGQASGLSQRGAIAFATMVQDESRFDPFAVGDGGDAQGLMQWNRVGSPDRVRRLEQFAKQRGKPVTDPGIQLNYAIYEMKNFYPSVWSVLSSRNPTNNQLWRATVEYLGFNPRVYAQRKASLEANLR